MNLKKRIKSIIYQYNYIGRSASYKDVIKWIPDIPPQTIERLMRKMAEEGELFKPKAGKYVLRGLEIDSVKKPKNLNHYL